ncbi:MAG TPA: hypothetical protein VF518_10510, partial [Polyangia bacterium]
MKTSNQEPIPPPALSALTKLARDHVAPPSPSRLQHGALALSTRGNKSASWSLGLALAGAGALAMGILVFVVVH